MPPQLIEDRLWRDMYARRVQRRPSDLYLWWAIFSDFRVSKPRNGGFPTTISFIAEGDANVWRDKFNNPRYGLKIAPSYLRPIVSTSVGKAATSRFFTFTIDVPSREGQTYKENRRPDADGGKLTAILLDLFSATELARLQLGFPRGRYANDAESPSKLGLTSESEVAAIEETDVVIGVVDNGAAFAHGSLRDKTGLKTRLVTVWNQSRDTAELTPQFWRSSSLGWYGAVLPKASMDDAMCKSLNWGEVNEIRCYASIMEDRESQRVLNNRDTHGAAVLTCAAGAINPSWMIDPKLGATSSPRSPFVDDAASRAPVIFVDLPYETTPVSSGRWMPIAALDAVRFILDEAQRRYCKKLKPTQEPVPIVINISSGSNAGSRDGRSMFESALAELLLAYPTLSVTIAAGNARITGSHAKRVIDSGKFGDLVVRVPAGKRAETYVEFWPEWEDRSVGERLSKYVSNLKFSLIAPDGTVYGPVMPDKDGALFKRNDGEVLAGLNFVEDAVQSEGRPMALLVVAATAPLKPFPHAPYGDWTVRCHNATGRSVRIKAWIERDDIVFGVRRPQLAHFCESGNLAPPINEWVDDDCSEVSRYDTFSNLANASGAFSVGAALGSRDDGYVSPYSGGGSVDGEGRPLLIARADRSSAKPGMPVFGAFGSARQHMNGTSIAAPQAARWIANYLAEGHDRTYIQTLAQFSAPRNHPHLKLDETGAGSVAASEGRWFIDPWDTSSKLGIGEKL